MISIKFLLHNEVTGDQNELVVFYSFAHANTTNGDKFTIKLTHIN